MMGQSPQTPDFGLVFGALSFTHIIRHGALIMGLVGHAACL
jgi:hypothetical protein